MILPVMYGIDEIGRVAVMTDAEGNISRVNVDGLKPWIESNMSDESIAQLESMTDTGGTVPLSATVDAGFTLVYDARDAWLWLEPDPARLRRRQLLLQETGFPPSHDLLQMATVSGFINARAGQDYLHETANDDGRQPFRLDLDSAVNVKGLVFEGQGGYIESADAAWERGNVRMVYDLPESMVRMAAGDLSYPVMGFQSYQPMLGVSIARNFSLQPYRVTEPSGQTSFILQSPARVDVMVNGQRVRTLQLAAGPYDISDFPVADGSNDVTLRITDATGRVEEKHFSMLSDQVLLKKGLHEYAYNIGLRSEMDNRRINYDAHVPVFSGFHRVGLTDTVTGGLSFQADKDVWQGGLSAAVATSFGTFGSEFAVSDARYAETDVAARLTYSYHGTKDQKNLSASAEYKGDDFARLGFSDPYNRGKWELAAGYYQTIFGNVYAGIGGRYRFARGGDDDNWSYSASLRKVLSPRLAVNINGQHQHNRGAGVFVGVTWMPWGLSHTVNASVDTLNKTQSVDWNWRDERRWMAGAGVTRSDGNLHGTGNLFYRGQRFDGSAVHDIARFENASGLDSVVEQRTQLRAGTALAFADGYAGWTRPVEGSFVLMARNANLDNTNIGINPRYAKGDVEEHEYVIDAAGPAVIPDVVPYYYRHLRVDTRDLPAGYDIPQDSFVSLPSYKRGSLIKVGSDMNIYADGYVADAEGNPVSLEAGVIRAIDNPSFAEQEFFTNRQGRFRITRLSPGQYRMRFYARPKQEVTLDVPVIQGFGRYDAGTLMLSESEKG